MLVFLIGLVLLVLMVMALGWDTANLFLGRRALNNLADGAAIAAANEIDERAYLDPAGPVLRLDRAGARAAVERYLTDLGTAEDSGLDQVTLVGDVETPGSSEIVNGEERVTVTIRLRARTPTFFIHWLGLAPFQITAESTAAARVVEPAEDGG